MVYNACCDKMSLKLSAGPLAQLSLYMHKRAIKPKPNYSNLKHPTTFQERNGELLLIKYRLIIMVGLWCYNQSDVTELLIMRDPHYGRMCF